MKGFVENAISFILNSTISLAAAKYIFIKKYLHIQKFVHFCQIIVNGYFQPVA